MKPRNQRSRINHQRNITITVCIAELHLSLPFGIGATAPTITTDAKRRRSTNAERNGRRGNVSPPLSRGGEETARHATEPQRAEVDSLGPLGGVSLVLLGDIRTDVFLLIFARVVVCLQSQSNSRLEPLEGRVSKSVSTNKQGAQQRRTYTPAIPASLAVIISERQSLTRMGFTLAFFCLYPAPEKAIPPTAGRYCKRDGGHNGGCVT